MFRLVPAHTYVTQIIIIIPDNKDTIYNVPGCSDQQKIPIANKPTLS